MAALGEIEPVLGETLNDVDGLRQPSNFCRVTTAGGHGEADEVRKWQHSRLGEIAIYAAAFSFGMYVVFGNLITRVLGISELAGQGVLVLLLAICAFVAFGPLGRKINRRDDP